MYLVSMPFHNRHNPVSYYSEISQIPSSFRKKKTNYFIVSLAFADLLVALVVMPFAAIELTTGEWRYGEIFCLVRTSLDVLLTTASILHLCCIALDRLVSIYSMCSLKSVKYIVDLHVVSSL